MASSATAGVGVPFRLRSLLFVWASWLLLLVVALTFVQRYGVRAPVGEDWLLWIPVLSGMRPANLELLWAQVNEHRVPLIKAVLLPLAWLTNGTFHVENYLNVIVLAGAAVVLMITACRLRGRYRFSDAFFPLALLQLGHFEVFLGRMMLNHVLSTALIGLVLAMLARHRGELSQGRAWLLGGLLSCLPLSGANGLPLVLACMLWFVYAAWRGPRGSPAERGRLRLSLLGPPMALALLVGLYFAGYKRPASHPPPQASGRLSKPVLRRSARAM